MPVSIGSGWKVGGGWSMGSGGAAPPPPPAVTDPYFMYNSLLLTGDGTNNSQNNTFLDSSTNNFAITRAGNTTQGTFSPYGANWSNYLGGVGNYFQTPASSASTIVGTLSNTANLTIECWIYPTAYNSSANFPGLIGDMNATFENNNWSWGITNTGTLMVYWNVSGTQLRATTSNAVSLNTWTHIALNVAAGAITMYINGVAQNLSGTTTLSTPSGSNGYLVIGQWNNGSGGTGGTSHGLYTGYISNLRVVKASTYTSGFTPSTVPLTAIANTSLLYCQSNRFKDNSSNAFALTVSGTPTVQVFSPFEPSAAYSTSTIGGSGYFDGTGDYVYAAANAAFNIGSNAASVEMWCYSTNAGVVVMCGQNGGPYSSIRILQYTNYAYTVSDDTIRDTGIPVILNAWTHLVVTITGGTARMFVNGVLRNVATGLGSVRIQGDSYVIGSEEGIANYYQGYMTDFRLVNGSIPTAYQTSSVTTGTTVFTPPTAPLTAVANTSLLLNYTNGGIVDSAMMTDLETVGDVKISTTQSKFGGSSMYFDGTGDYLITPANPVSNLGTGDFTIEMWVYLTNSEATTQTIMGGDLSTQSASTNTIQIWYNNGGSRNKISFNVYGNPRFDSSSSVSINNWMHLAFTRSSGTFRMFINGTQEASGSLPNNLSNNVFVVGRGYISFNQEYFNGYIDDLRVTKGVARYTSNFTPPTSALLAGGSVTSTTTGPIASGITMGGTGTGMVISSYVAPWTIGGFYQGGYYCGNFVDNGVTYKLLAAPSSTVSGLGWGPSAVSGFQSRIAGPTNSAGETALGSSYAAATYCESLTSGGYSDWYLPAVNELQTAITNTNGVAPFASGGAQSWSGQFWSSSELDVDYRDGYMNLNRWWPQDHAWFVNGTTVYGTYGVIDKNNKSASYSVRAFRRVAA